MKYKCLFLFLVTLGWAQTAQAGVLVSPTRLAFEPRQREATVTLVNPENQAQEYRVSFVNFHATDDGSYEAVTTPTSPTGEKFAAFMLRFSPKVVKLQPKQSQVVRIQLRKPKDLLPGEYRSHLMFTQIQNTPPSRRPSAVTKSTQNQVSMRVIVNYGISIPVIVRQGEGSATLAMGKPTLEKSKTSGSHMMRVRLQRSGAHSIYGDIEVGYQAQAGQGEVIVGELNGLTVLTPNTVRNVNFPITLPPTARGGILRLRFTDRDKKLGVIADAQLPFSP